MNANCKCECEPQTQTLKMNATTIKHSQANNTIVTHHIRHIFMPVNQTNKNILFHATTCQM